MGHKNPVFNELDDIVVNEPEEEVGELGENDYESEEKVYFAFIDVLGFKKTFDDIRISNQSNEAKKYNDVFNYYFRLMGEAKFMRGNESEWCYAGQTSDSLYFYTKRADFLLEFMKIFSHFNLYAMSKNVFFRGGIAKGNLYKKEKYQFYGNSVIYAYLMESKISKYPIIVIDENTHKDLKEFSEYESMVDCKNERHYIKPFRLLNEPVTLDLEDPKGIERIDKKAIQSNIEANKKLFEYEVENYNKYVFLQKELEEADNSEVL